MTTMDSDRTLAAEIARREFASLVRSRLVLRGDECGVKTDHAAAYFAACRTSIIAA
jgi:hypothetical protein